MSYRIRQVLQDSTEIEALIRLFERVWPEGLHLTREYVEWQYWGNPAGAVVGVNAWSGGEIVGHYVTIPSKAVREGRRVNGLLSLNTAVHPLHQGKGLFTQLAGASYEIGRTEGYECVVGVANSNSVHGFIKKLGFSYLGQLEARVALRVPECNEDQVSDANMLWRGEWPIEKYEWRLSNPSRRYTRRFARNGEACYVFGSIPRAGMCPLVKVECRPEFVKYLRDRLPPARGVPYYWFGTGAGRIRFRAPTLGIPKRLQRPPLHLILRELSESRGMPQGDVMIEPLDFDLV